MKNIDALDLQVAVDELQESIRMLAEQQNVQYNDLVTRINDLKDDLRDNLNDLKGGLEAIEALGEEEYETFSGTEDEMYEEAKKVVIESGKASTSWLQRKLGIGYSKAASLIDQLEQKGVVGPAKGSKAREVYRES